MLHHIEICLLIVSIVTVSTFPVVSSQSSGCYFTAMNLYGPPSVQVGQKFDVETLFSVTCTGAGFYTVRADLADARTGQILSTSRTTFSILGPFAAVITSSVVAPITAGWWPLQMNLYVLNLSGVPIAPQSQQMFGLAILSSQSNQTSHGN